MVVAVGDGREEERMDVGDKKQASYLDYIPLWLHIMDPSKLKALTELHTCTYLYDCVGTRTITSVLYYFRAFN